MAPAPLEFCPQGGLLSLRSFRLLKTELLKCAITVLFDWMIRQLDCFNDIYLPLLYFSLSAFLYVMFLLYLYVTLSRAHLHLAYRWRLTKANSVFPLLLKVSDCIEREKDI